MPVLDVCWMISASLAKMALSIGSLVDLLSSEPATRHSEFVLGWPPGQRHTHTFDFFGRASESAEGDARVLCEHEVLLAMLAEANLEEPLDVRGDDIGL